MACHANMISLVKYVCTVSQTYEHFNINDRVAFYTSSEGWVGGHLMHR